jgi:hypothetical protein
MTRSIRDPMERMIAEALDEACIAYSVEGENGQRLDFYLPEHELFIEVKQFHSDRIASQLRDTPNVIVAQGRPAVTALAALLRTMPKKQALPKN